MWDWIILLAVGALSGWIASMIMNTNDRQNGWMNVIVGIIGAFLARFIFGSVFNLNSADAAGNLSLGGILWGVAGSVVLLFIVQAISRLTHHTDASNDRHAHL